MKELKPCPYCGGEANFRITSTGEFKGSPYVRISICCTRCGATQSDSAMVSYGYDPHSGAYASERQLIDAIERWNRRAYEQTD